MPLLTAWRVPGAPQRGGPSGSSGGWSGLGRQHSRFREAKQLEFAEQRTEKEAAALRAPEMSRGSLWSPQPSPHWFAPVKKLPGAGKSLPEDQREQKSELTQARKCSFSHWPEWGKVSPGLKDVLILCNDASKQISKARVGKLLWEGPAAKYSQLCRTYVPCWSYLTVL